MFSIDQNCHPLWDVVPKLQALAEQGRAVTHFIEDVDMAYTAIGAAAGDRPRLAPERFHRSGGADCSNSTVTTSPAPLRHTSSASSSVAPTAAARSVAVEVEVEAACRAVIVIHR